MHNHAVGQDVHVGLHLHRIAGAFGELGAPCFQDHLAGENGAGSVDAPAAGVGAHLNRFALPRHAAGPTGG